MGFDNIEGILLELSSVPSGLATIEEIRNALIKFKESGKFIVSYGEVYSQKAYYLASVADEVYLNPEGYVAIDSDGSAVKLVDRMEFSMNNFNAAKAWDK